MAQPARVPVIYLSGFSCIPSDKEYFVAQQATGSLTPYWFEERVAYEIAGAQGERQSAIARRLKRDGSIRRVSNYNEKAKAKAKGRLLEAKEGGNDKGVGGSEEQVKETEKEKARENKTAREKTSSLRLSLLSRSKAAVKKKHASLISAPNLLGKGHQGDEEEKEASIQISQQQESKAAESNEEATIKKNELTIEEEAGKEAKPSPPGRARRPTTPLLLFPPPPPPPRKRQQHVPRGTAPIPLLQDAQPPAGAVVSSQPLAHGQPGMQYAVIKPVSVLFSPLIQSLHLSSLTSHALILFFSIHSKSKKNRVVASYIVR